jgi:F-type H+-transporting ATPase subunit gamma
MATLRQINRRIRSIQTTAKTTRAMSLVAGSKMRRAQLMATSHRPYADELGKLLTNVVASIEAAGGLTMDGESAHPLLQAREVKVPGILLITSDRGLCGGLNTNLIRAAAQFVTTHPGTKMVTVGRKGNDFYSRTRTDIIGHFGRLGDYPSFDEVRPVARLIADAYIAGEIDSVVIVYPRFVNTVIQRPEVLDLLPLTPPTDPTGPRPTEYIYEPDASSVLAALLPRYVEIQVYRAVLELAASFQSAQMVAMRNATDAANEMIQELTLVRNKVRQEQITKELLDITGGVEALNAS